MQATHLYIHKDIKFKQNNSSLQKNSFDLLKEMCINGLHERYKKPSDSVIERLNLELSAFKEKGYVDLLLIVRAALSDESAEVVYEPAMAASLALYCMGISNVDPMEYGLLFERFANVKRNYAPDLSFHIASSSLENFLSCVTENVEKDGSCKAVKNKASDSIICLPKESANKYGTDVSKFNDSDILECFGIYLIDNVALDVVYNTIAHVSNKNDVIDIHKISLNDKKVLRSISLDNETIAPILKNSVYGYNTPESEKSFWEKYRLITFEDLVAGYTVCNFLRSGIDDFATELLRRKNSTKWQKYEILEIDEILSETLGMILYQEQIMKILQVFGGYSGTEADIIRRDMSARRASALEPVRDEFYKDDKMTTIFDDIYHAAGFSYPKCFEVCGARIFYYVSWLKYYYPSEFMDNLKSAIDSSDNICSNLRSLLQFS